MKACNIHVNIEIIKRLLCITVPKLVFRIQGLIDVGRCPRGVIHATTFSALLSPTTVTRT